jgi:hypothetical protein
MSDYITDNMIKPPAGEARDSAGAWEKEITDLE